MNNPRIRDPHRRSLRQIHVCHPVPHMRIVSRQLPFFHLQLVFLSLPIDHEQRVPGLDGGVLQPRGNNGASRHPRVAPNFVEEAVVQNDDGKGASELADMPAGVANVERPAHAVGDNDGLKRVGWDNVVIVRKPKKECGNDVARVDIG